MDWSHLNDAILGAFGETVTVTVGGVGHALQGAYRAPWTGMAVGGMPVERPDPTLSVRSADWAATGGREGDTVQLRGQTLRVTAIQPDDAGMTELTLRAFP